MCEREHVPVEKVIAYARLCIQVPDPEQNDVVTKLIITTDPPCRECKRKACSAFIFGGDGQWHGLSKRILKQSFPNVLDPTSVAFMNADWFSNARF